MVAQAIGDHVGQTGFAGRWGGEEFAIVLPNADPAAAYRVAEQIRTAVAALVIEDRQGRHIPAPTVSQGIATLPITALTAQDLVEQADRAVYRAKHCGKNQIAVAEKK
jgi:diguanylate cyclase (GGDEF)-like protein